MWSKPLKASHNQYNGRPQGFDVTGIYNVHVYIRRREGGNKERRERGGGKREEERVREE